MTHGHASTNYIEQDTMLSMTLASHNSIMASSPCTGSCVKSATPINQGTAVLYQHGHTHLAGSSLNMDLCTQHLHPSNHQQEDHTQLKAMVYQKNIHDAQQDPHCKTMWHPWTKRQS